MKDKSIGVIPARYASTRFPGKPLVDIQGKSMIQRVYEQVQQAELIDTVIVATDDKRIFQHVQNFGGKVAMTSDKHLSGTDRCAEIATSLEDYDIVVNIQGDEPFIQPKQIDALIRLLLDHETVDIATLSKKIKDKAVFLNPNVVKVVFDKQQRALYFSRSPIPFARGIANGFQEGIAYKHIGLYGFRRKILLDIAKLPPSKLETIESLEQLRWLDNGYQMMVGITELESMGIDSPEDLLKL